MLESPHNSYIKLTFNEFDVGRRSEICKSDYVDVYSGQSITGTHRGRFCKARMPNASILSDFSYLYIVFVSDGIDDLSTGWFATYRFVNITFAMETNKTGTSCKQVYDPMT